MLLVTFHDNIYTYGRLLFCLFQKMYYSCLRHWRDYILFCLLRMSPLSLDILRNSTRGTQPQDEVAMCLQRFGMMDEANKGVPSSVGFRHAWGLRKSCFKHQIFPAQMCREARGLEPGTFQLQMDETNANIKCF